MGIAQDAFLRRCKAEKLIGNSVGHANMFWRVPIKYVLWWNKEAEEVCFVPNEPHCLCDPANHHVAAFDDLGYAFTAYTLMNP